MPHGIGTEREVQRLKRHKGHQKFSNDRVYSAVCRSKSWKQYLRRLTWHEKGSLAHVHFSSRAANIPMCPISLSFENGPVPSLFLARFETKTLSFSFSHCSHRPWPSASE